MKVTINVTDRRFKVNDRALRALVRKVLADETASQRSVNIVYCRDKDMVALSKEFRGNKKATDVLAFDLHDEVEPDFLGEVYVNLQQARRQSREIGIPYNEEVRRLTIHGVLHLLGYDDNNVRNRHRMWARQEGYLKAWTG